MYSLFGDTKPLFTMYKCDHFEERLLWTCEIKKCEKCETKNSCVVCNDNSMCCECYGINYLRYYTVVRNRKKYTCSLSKSENINGSEKRKIIDQEKCSKNYKTIRCKNWNKQQKRCMHEAKYGPYSCTYWHPGDELKGFPKPSCFDKYISNHGYDPPYTQEDWSPRKMCSHGKSCLYNKMKKCRFKHDIKDN